MSKRGVTLCVLPKLDFVCEIAIERCRIEVMEAQVEDSVSAVRRSADKVCHYCISHLLIEISFPIQLCAIEYEY